MFKIDLRELQRNWPIWSSKPAQPRAEFMTMDLQIHDKRSKFTVQFDAKPQHHPGEIPIGSDMIHVSGGGRKDDFLDDPLALPSSHGRPSTRLIYFNTRNLEKLIRN